MELPQEINVIQERTSMYLRVVNYDTVAACIQGIDIGRNGELLAGFGDWLRTQVDRGHNMTWSVLVLLIAFPNTDTPWKRLDSEADDEHARKVLFKSLEEFYRVRTG